MEAEILDKIKEIVEQVKKKEIEGDKELLQYLYELDTGTLNQLLYLFGGRAPISLRRVFAASLASSALIGGYIIIVILAPTGFNSTMMELTVSILFMLFGLFMAIYYNFTSSPTFIFKSSQKMKINTKLMTVIKFVLETKYKELL
jgi:hypothetical protein